MLNFNLKKLKKIKSIDCTYNSIAHAMGWRVTRASHYNIALLTKVYTDV